MHHNDQTKKVQAIRQPSDARTVQTRIVCTRCHCPILQQQGRQQTTDGSVHLNPLDCSIPA